MESEFYALLVLNKVVKPKRFCSLVSVLKFDVDSFIGLPSPVSLSHLPSLDWPRPLRGLLLLWGNFVAAFLSMHATDKCLTQCVAYLSYSTVCLPRPPAPASLSLSPVVAAPCAAVSTQRVIHPTAGNCNWVAVSVSASECVSECECECRCECE